MIGTVVRVGLLRMWHGRTEILLTFVVPIAFFTIFAFIFDEQIGLGKSPRVDIAIVDEDSTELSREFVAALAEWETLHVYAPADHEERALRLHLGGARQGARARGNAPAGGGHPEGWSAIAHEPRRPKPWVSDCWPTPRTRWPPRSSPRCCGRPRAGSLAERARQQVQVFLSLSPDEFARVSDFTVRDDRPPSRWSISSPPTRPTPWSPCTPPVSR